MIPSRHDMADLLGPAALGLLTTPEQEQLDQHLRSCEQCREELAALTAVAARLADVDPQAALAVAPGRADAVLTQLGRSRRRAQLLQGLVAAAASVAVLVAGLVTAGTLGTEPAPGVPLEAVAVSGEQGIQARADLVAHTWGVEIKLAAAGLEAGSPYTVQVRTEQGELVGAGAFLGTGDKTLLCNLNASVLREDARAFSVLDAVGRTVLSANL